MADRSVYYSMFKLLFLYVVLGHQEAHWGTSEKD